MLPLPEDKGVATLHDYAKACIGMRLAEVEQHFASKQVRHRIVCRDGKPDAAMLPQRGIVNLEVGGEFVIAAEAVESGRIEDWRQA